MAIRNVLIIDDAVSPDVLDGDSVDGLGEVDLRMLWRGN